MIGGFGNLAWGRHQWGAPASDIKPTFYTSSPQDEETNVGVQRWVEFYLYNYSSILDPAEVEANLAVDEYGTGVYVPTNASPYRTAVRAFDGQKLWVKVLKAGPWRANATITFRVTGTDEFGNEVVKEVPVEWS
jgi:hypothetical protein